MIRRVVGLGGLKVRLVTILLVVNSMTLSIDGVGAVVCGLVTKVFVSATSSDESVVVTRLRNRDRLWHRNEDRLRQSDWMRYGDRMWDRDWFRNYQRHLNRIELVIGLSNVKNCEVSIKLHARLKCMIKV